METPRLSSEVGVANGQGVTELKASAAELGWKKSPATSRPFKQPSPVQSVFLEVDIFSIKHTTVGNISM